MGTELVWPSLCLIVGLILLVGEAFIPSGGLIGMLSLGFLAVSLWLAFTTTTHGPKFLVAMGLLLPVTLMLAVYLWPRTPLAKYLFLAPPTAEEVETEPIGPALHHLVGQYGRALTPLRPAGMVDFEGRRLDGLAEDGLIPVGVLVKAVSVRSGQVVVRRADPPPGLGDRLAPELDDTFEMS